ncbi:G-patch domain-containing protein [Apiospora aurea]|uniref:G-patch domain-containing protein n=1 Tax=Apiospora aurea TaxID=335848 RepID=A0ABR1QJR6_9PEZI
MAPLRDTDDGEDDIPLEHKKPFSAGLRRKLIQFVPASAEETASTEQNRATSTPAKSIEDIYLNIVMPPRDTASAPPESPASHRICELCQLPVDGGATASHETSIAHQVYLEHSHPPSALDRSRMGLAVLQSQGWDPDARKGLGVAQQGVQYPIKAKQKEDTLGIGVQVPKDLEKWKKEKPQNLDAAKVRKKVAEDKKRREKLQRQFYGNPDIEKYLG